MTSLPLNASCFSNSPIVSQVALLTSQYGRQGAFHGLLFKEIMSRPFPLLQARIPASDLFTSPKKTGKQALTNR